MGATLWIAAVLLLGSLALLAARWFRLRGKGIVTCPENGETAAVSLDAWRALLGRRRLRLSRCSRWPARGDCGQPCLERIGQAPEDCLVRNIVARWYEGKSCACCGSPLAPIRWSQHKPCLMSPELRIVQWREVQAERLPAVLATHAPVCWTCNVAETHTW